MTTNEDTPRDPRLSETDGEQGMPGEVLDSPTNMPGDQPADGDEKRPDLTDLKEDPAGPKEDPAS